MRGKFEKKKKKKSRGPWWLVILLTLVLGLLIALCAVLDDEQEGAHETQPANTVATTAPVETTENVTEPSYTFEQEVEGVTSFSLDRGLEITRYGKYIGVYMEDGTDEFVTNVMMIVVENTGEDAIQYAAITLSGPSGDASFTLTTLMPGQSVVVLEAGRKPYSDTDIYTQAKAENVAIFPEMPSLLEDQFQIQPLEGGFNITNISGADINGEIVIYFKDFAGDMYYGGITYACRIAEGLKDREVRQIMSANFTESSSRVVFIKINQ